MKTHTLNTSQPTGSNSLMTPLLTAAVALSLLIAPKIHAASQTWTNAPADPDWTNTLNWSGLAIPGAVNSTTVADIVTFNTALFNGIGGASNPITNDFQRGVRGFLFDTGAGPYVFGHNTLDNYLEVNQTGNITINAPVLNPIQFLEGMRFRGPSSQNYTYAFTNNATSPNGTIFIQTITNAANSTTRPITLTFGGSNTGTNTLGYWNDAADSEGAVVIIKVGTGRWVFSGTNDFPQKTSASVVAAVQVLGGTLELQNSGSIGGITQANTIVGNAGTLQIDNVTITNGTGANAAGVTLTNGGTLRMNGSGTVTGLGIGAAASTVATLGTTSLSDVLTIGNAVTKLTGGASDTIVHVNGPGTTQLAFSSSFVGKWSFDAGTIQLGDPAALGTAAAKISSIAAGATLDVSPIFVLGNSVYELPSFSASGSGTVVGSTAATINAGVGSTNGIVDIASAVPVALAYTPTSSSGDLTHPSLFISQGTLSLNGNAFTINNASGAALGAGTYTIVKQATGTVTQSGSSVATVTGSGVIPGAVATIQVSGGSVNLVITVYVSQNLVWLGGNPGTIWDAGTNANWLDGGTASIFHDSDNVTFNSVGVANSSVTLDGTLAPGSVTVDTSAGNYTFSGSGSIAGSTSLVKINSGTLIVQNVNGYTGGTFISNGIITLGNNDALPDAGGGDVAINASATLDLNGFNEDVNGLNGSGTVDNIQGGGDSALSVGNNGDNGSFTGVIQSTGGTLGVAKNGNGLQLIGGANDSYTGGTTVNAGTLQLGSATALTTNASVTINGGNLDINGFNVVLTTLAGAAGNIVDNSGAATNTLSIISGAANTFGGTIEDNTGTGGKIALFVSGGGNLRLNANATFSGGTVVDTNTTLSFGTITQIGSSGIFLSNNATLAMPTAVSTAAAISNNITTADNSMVFFTSGETADTINGSFFGSATATNVFNGNISLGGTMAFSNFLGRVVISNFNGAGVRFFNNSGVFGGGDAAIFDMEGGALNPRNPGAGISLGALTGNGTITGPSVPVNAGAPAILSIGGKGLSTSFEGTISGSNSLVKIGAGTLKLDGILVDGTLTDGATYTNSQFDPASQITYVGNTTVSNGVLALVVPNLLTNSPVIALAGTSAVLDASAMGYVSNLFDQNSNLTNTALITNGILEIPPTNSLDGFGTVRGTLLADVDSILNPGNVTGALTNIAGTGVLNITGPASIFGAVNILLNNTNTVNSGELSAASFSIDPGATLLITNVGPALQGGNVFQLFNHAVSFATVTLPMVPSNIVLSNMLAINGSLEVISLVNTNATNVTVAYNNTTGVANITWPSDHTGWRLQTQTNAPGTGVTTNWVTVVGSTNVNTLSFTNVPGNGSVFFRMVYP